STSHRGYNQTLTIAVATNSMKKQSGFDGFEDYLFENCQDDHFKIGKISDLSNTESHSGRYSIAVTAGNPVIFHKQIKEACDIKPCQINYTIEEDPSYPNDPNYKLILHSLYGYTLNYEIVYGYVNVVVEEQPEAL